VAKDSLPARWIVQLVSYTNKGTQVSTMPLSGNKGSVQVNPAQQGLKKLVVIVYTTAPKTTVSSGYTLSGS
jgi:hypothetical protein